MVLKCSQEAVVVLDWAVEVGWAALEAAAEADWGSAAMVGSD